MQERVRICDIAEELGLSTATVSNVIHGKTDKVSDATVQRVTALLEERQYIPSMAGILLAQNSSGIIGVFVNDHQKYAGHTLSDGFLASSLDHLSTEIERSGQFMMVKKPKAPGMSCGSRPCGTWTGSSCLASASRTIPICAGTSGSPLSSTTDSAEIRSGF